MSIARTWMLGLIIGACITGNLFANDPPPKDAWRVVCYNVFNGFQGGRSFEKTVKWINTQKPDLLGLQELVGWNEKRLKVAALKWHHPHAVTLKGGGYNIGLTSVDPIEVIERRTSGFHHGVLHCRVRGIDVLVTHLWPGGVPQQLGEVKILTDIVRKMRSEGRQVLVMGDFNAHASSDRKWMKDQGPLIKRRLVGDKRKSPGARFLKNGKFTYHIMDAMLKAALHDVIRDAFDAAHKRANRSQLLQLGSYPTRILKHANKKKEQRGFLERIDFILATKGLANVCVIAKVCRKPIVLEELSDHYPVIATFELKPGK